MHRQTFSKDNQGLPQYCFIIFIRQQDNTVAVNLNKFHANIQNINLRYPSNKYLYLDQNASLNKNQYAK